MWESGVAALASSYQKRRGIDESQEDERRSGEYSGKQSGRRGRLFALAERFMSLFLFFLERKDSSPPTPPEARPASAGTDVERTMRESGLFSPKLERPRRGSYISGTSNFRINPLLWLVASTSLRFAPGPGYQPGIMGIAPAAISNVWLGQTVFSPQQPMSGSLLTQGVRLRALEQ